MRGPLAELFLREARLARRIGGGGAMGVVFFLILVTITPFAIGPDLNLLSRIGPAVLWIAALHAAGGGYMGMIVLLWLTHFAIALSFGYLLLRMETPPLAASFAVLMFGLTWTNQETLMWSMQWSAQLALLFFFAAWWLLILILETPAPASGLTCLYTLSVLASGLCSSRNMTGGAVLAVFILLSGTSRRHWLLCGLSLLPGALLACAMWLFVPYHQATVLSAASFGIYYFLLNPLYLLLSFPGRAVDVRALVIFGTAKILITAWALAHSRGALRRMLWTFLVFELITAASLGYARSYTGLPSTVSSRYQYLSLLCFAPAAGIAWASLRKQAQVLVLLISLGLIAYPWRTHLPFWAKLRGSDVRQELQQKSDDERFDPSSLTAGRARDLVHQYHLH